MTWQAVHIRQTLIEGNSRVTQNVAPQGKAVQVDLMIATLKLESAWISALEDRI
jgi:hypothetical protein